MAGLLSMVRRDPQPRPQDSIVIRYRCASCSTPSFYFTVWGYLSSHVVRPPMTMPCERCLDDGHCDPLDAWSVPPDMMSAVLKHCANGSDGVLNDYRPAPIELIRFRVRRTQPDDVREWWQQA